MTVQPLILTLGLDPEVTERLERLRARHFPPERLVVGAHLTLFHALPGEHEAEVIAELRSAGARTAPLDLRADRVVPLGRGVAIAVEGPGLAPLRAQLARAFAPWLSAQDRQGHRPHVTVQNKVTPEHARRTFAQVTAGWAPTAVRGEALHLWRYLGGPWEHVLDVGLTGAPRIEH